MLLVASRQSKRGSASLVLELEFSVSLGSHSYSNTSDIRVSLERLGAENYYLSRAYSEGNNLILWLEFLQPFAESDEISVLVPTASQIRSVEGVPLNSEGGPQELLGVRVERMLVESANGQSLRRVQEDFKSLEGQILDRQNVFTQLLSLLNLFKHLMNNQGFLLILLMDIHFSEVCFRFLGSISSPFLNYVPEYEEKLPEEYDVPVFLGVTIRSAQFPNQGSSFPRFSQFKIPHCFLVNTFQFAVQLSVLLTCYFALSLFLRWKREEPRAAKLRLLVWNFFYKVFESSNLLVYASVFLQVERASFASALNGLSLFAALGTFAVFAWLFLLALRDIRGINAKTFRRVYLENEELLSDLRYQQLINEPPSAWNRLQLNFHLLGQAKKCFYCLLLVALRASPTAQVTLIFIVHLLFSAFVARFRPYRTLPLNLCRVALDFFYAVFLLMVFALLSYNESLASGEDLEEKVERVITVCNGLIILVLLYFVFQLAFFVMKIYLTYQDLTRPLELSYDREDPAEQEAPKNASTTEAKLLEEGPEDFPSIAQHRPLIELQPLKEGEAGS